MPDSDIWHREHKAGSALRAGEEVVFNPGPLEKASLRRCGHTRGPAFGRGDKPQEARVCREESGPGATGRGDTIYGEAALTDGRFCCADLSKL